jgi:TIR domain-containing protein
VIGASRAVFLSYASEDAEAAERLAAALRLAGIEVWFDKSELRGGDAWDHHIRQQIPIGSAGVGPIEIGVAGVEFGYRNPTDAAFSEPA